MLQSDDMDHEPQMDVYSEYSPIENLQEMGINASDIAKLRAAGIVTIGMVLQRSSRDLLNIKGFSEAKVDKIKDMARKADLNGSAFKTGLEVKERRNRVLHITTGSQNLNSILGGGIETASITEVFGEFRTGKTQLAHTMAVSCQLGAQMGGGEGKVIYCDTEGNFRPERIEQIAERFGLDPQETLENIIVNRVFTHEEQMNVLTPIAGLLSDPDAGPFRMLIVDSVIALFRSEFVGRGELSERQQKLSTYLSGLVRLAEEFNIVVFIVNQCMADPGAMSMFGPVVKPVGGHILAHASTTRIWLKKGKGEQRIAKIFDSPSMPPADAVIQIGEGGILDVD